MRHSVLSDELTAAFSLTDRVAIVTGGGRGIGAEIGRTLAAAGARVVLADLDSEGAAQTAAEICENGGPAWGQSLDVSRRDAVEALVAAVVAEHGRLDVMVNNAGIITNNNVLDTTEEEFDRVLAVNVKGVLFGCQSAARAMLSAGRGAIINMASQAADSPAPGVCSYATSKAAVVQLTRSLAIELAPLGVRVNAVAPGITQSPMTERHFRREDGSIDEAARDEVLAGMRATLPMGILGRPRDQALAVLYLASDASSFVTGQIMRPNGGAAML